MLKTVDKMKKNSQVQNEEKSLFHFLTKMLESQSLHTCQKFLMLKTGKNVEDQDAEKEQEHNAQLVTFSCALQWKETVSKCFMKNKLPWLCYTFHLVCMLPFFNYTKMCFSTYIVIHFITFNKYVWLIIQLFNLDVISKFIYTFYCTQSRSTVYCTHHFTKIVSKRFF